MKPSLELMMLHLVAATFLSLQVAHTAVTAEASAGEPDVDESLYKLPEGFLLGVGSSSYQTEGAWNADGKGENVYDYTLHLLKGAANVDVGPDGYHRFREDIALAAQMKLDVYRFSLSWARIFPNGRRSSLEPRGVQHYHKVIDEIIKYGMKPFVTISHFDYPQALRNEFNAWLNETMVDVYEDFADFVFKEYGGKVKYWVTLNEPNTICSLWPRTEILDSDVSFTVPGLAISDIVSREDYFRCVHHQILAHNAAYRTYRQKYAAQNGVVGMSGVSFFARPNSTDYADVAAAERVNLFNLGILFHPLVFGDYPAVMKELLPESLLRSFTEEQKRLLPGTIDFLGVNAYDGLVVYDSWNRKPNSADLDVITMTQLEWLAYVSQCDNARASVIESTGSTPWILADVAQWLTVTYGRSIPIMVTENGSQGSKSIHDSNITPPYVSAFLRPLIKATHEFGLNVRAYFYWSLLDGYEFDYEYEMARGLIHVDYATGSLNRTLKDSWRFFEQMATTRRVPLALPTASGGGGHHAAPSASIVGLLALGAALAVW